MSAAKIYYRISKEHNALLVWVSGAISFAKAMEFLQTFLQDPNFAYGMDSFYDLSACTDIDGDLKHAAEISALVSGESMPLLPAKTAFLLPENNEKVSRVIHGMMLMFSASPIEHACFNQTQREQSFDYLNFDQGFRMDIDKFSQQVFAEPELILAVPGITALN
ncbi:hypothetical protein [Alteromonas flava]|uniref:hypothetical protein n=1 Tax=Alteromonas flava TaxID=2048003 RepID=UPI000C291E6A|nr:hypothetical protein [Alteromonas flava]